MTDKMGILERVNFVLKPGTSRAEFSAAFALARPYLENSKGCRRIEIRYGVENPDTCILLIWWETIEDHLKGFRESDAFPKYRGLILDFFTTPPTMEHFLDPV